MSIRLPSPTTPTPRPLSSEAAPRKSDTLWKKADAPSVPRPRPLTPSHPTNFITTPLRCIVNGPESPDPTEEAGAGVEGFAETSSAAISDSEDTTTPPAKGGAQDTITTGKLPSARLALQRAISSIKNTLLSPAEAADAAGFWIASEVASLCAASPNKKDTQIIQEQLTIFIAVVASCYIVYNWYFMQFYHEGLLRVRSICVSPDALHSVSPMLFLFFKYNVVPVWALDHFLLRVFPRIFGGALSQKAVMVLLFALVVGGINAFSGRIYKSLVSSILLKPDSLAGVYVFSMVVYAVYSLVSFDRSGMPADSAAIAEKFYLMFQSPLMTSAMTVAIILRFLWSSIIVGTSALMVTLYLIFMSMFAIMFYSKVSLAETITNINWYVARPRAEDTCAPSCDNGPYSTAKYIVCAHSARALGVVYKHAFELAVLVCLARGVRTYSASSMDSDLKSGMIAICAIIACIVCGIAGARALGAADDAAKELAYQRRLFESAEAILGYTADKDHKYAADNFDAHAASVECSPCGKSNKSLFEWVAGFFSGPLSPAPTSSIITGIRDSAAATIGAH
jgi:hypothetical protein